VSAGVLNHLKSFDPKILVPDYSKEVTACTVYINAARCIIHEGNVARMLSICGIGHVHGPEEISEEEALKGIILKKRPQQVSPKRIPPIQPIL